MLWKTRQRLRKDYDVFTHVEKTLLYCVYAAPADLRTTKANTCGNLS